LIFPEELEFVTDSNNNNNNNENNSNNNSTENKKSILIEIFFKRKNNLQILVERWTVESSFDSNPSNKIFRKILLIKKLSTFIRSIYMCTRMLPVYNLVINQEFDYKIDYKFHSFSQNLSSSNNFDTTNEKFLKIRKSFKNMCDIGVGRFNLEVEYLLKSDIFILEQEIVKYFHINII
jgi:hypothetical protein